MPRRGSATGGQGGRREQSRRAEWLAEQINGKEMDGKRTVHDFLDLMAERAGVSLPEIRRRWTLSPPHDQFMKKVLGLSKVVAAKEGNNIDEATPLTSKEWEELMAELKALPPL